MNQRTFATGLFLLVLGCAYVGAACSSDPATTPPTGPGTPSGTTRVAAASGGTVTDSSGKTTLTIPPGALAQDTDISLAISPKSGSALVDISDFGPDGLTFLKPATLSIKGDASLAPSGKTLALAVLEGADFKPLPGSAFASGAATAPITHFSTYSLVAVGGAPVDDAGPGVDSGKDGGPGDSGFGGCQPTGGLPPPSAGKTTIVATFSGAAGGYNGSTETFTGEELYGSTDPDAARFISYDKAPSPSDDTLRQLVVATGPNPTACQVFSPVAAPAAGPTYFNYYEGAGLRRQWFCGGTVVVDTVVDKSYTFHFDVTCAKSPVLDAIGTVKIAGKGAGTRP